jgi:hypothetical protein
MRHHLAAVGALLNLDCDQRHRTFFALAVMAWQGVKRSGDLLLPKASSPDCVWDPAQRLHRGRQSVRPSFDGMGRLVGETLVVANKPSKTNQAGALDESYTR